MRMTISKEIDNFKQGHIDSLNHTIGVKRNIISEMLKDDPEKKTNRSAINKCAGEIIKLLLEVKFLERKL